MKSNAIFHHAIRRSDLDLLPTRTRILTFPTSKPNQNPRLFLFLFSPLLVFLFTSLQAYLQRTSQSNPMKTFQVAGGNTLSVSLFSDVTNTRELVELMQSGKMEPEVALVNASLVPDIFPVLAAAHKVLVSKSRESLTTRTLHSELVYNYSGSKHIRESLKRCGISDQISYILAARFNASDDEMTSVAKLINGKEIDLGELESRSNRDNIIKHYKVPPQELAISSIADAIACRIAARDAL